MLGVRLAAEQLNMRDETLNNWVKLVTNPIYCSICGHVTYAEKKLKVHEKKHATDGAMARVNEQLILDAKAAATTLLASLDEGAMSREERRAIEQTPVELQQRYGALRVMMLLHDDHDGEHLGDVYHYQDCHGKPFPS